MAVSELKEISKSGKLLNESMMGFILSEVACIS